MGSSHPLEDALEEFATAEHMELKTVKRYYEAGKKELREGEIRMYKDLERLRSEHGYEKAICAVASAVGDSRRIAERRCERGRRALERGSAEQGKSYPENK